MTACTVSGNTFTHRDMLKNWGGRWNQSARNWTFDDLEPDRIDRLRRFVGVVVNEIESDVSEFLAWARRPEHPREPTVCFGDDKTYLNYFADQNPSGFFGFSSLRKFTDYVAVLPPIDNDERTGRHHAWLETEKAVTKTATRSMPEALRLAREGWSDGLGITDKLDPPRSTRKRRLRTVAGGTVSVGRMLAGNPAHMIRRARLPGHRIITLYVECGMWRGITSWNAMLRAWLIIAMVDALEIEGYRCEIVAVDVAMDDRNEHPGYQVAIHLKSAGDRLSFADLSFALGHPSLSRRMVFACVSSAEACRDCWTHMGCISDAFTDKHPTGRNEFYIPQLLPHQQSQLDDTNPFDMLRFIQPDGLPVKLVES
jgi:hypothetical protein